MLSSEIKLAIVLPAPWTAWVPDLLGGIRSLTCHHRRNEFNHHRYNLRERFWRVGMAKAFTESLPLWLLAVYKSGRKGTGFRDFRSACLERAFNPTHQIFQSELMLARKKPDIIKVFHPTVQFAKVHHRLKLLSDGRLRCVALNSGGGKIQQGWELQPGGKGKNRVAKSDVQLHRDSGLIEKTGEGHSQPLIIGIFGNAIHFQSVRIKAQAIIDNVRSNNITNLRQNRLRLIAGLAQHVDIPGRAAVRPLHGPKHQRALEGETVVMGRLAQ